LRVRRWACMPRWVAATDFDGIITLKDVGFETMRHYNPPGWWEIEVGWREGRLTTREALEGQFGLLRITEEEYREFVLSFETDGEFPDFVKFCRGRGVEVAVLSDGFDLYIGWILERLGVSDLTVYANVARIEGRIFRFEYPHFNPQCGRCGCCKRRIIEGFKGEGLKVLYVGEGFSDLCPADLPDLLFAKRGSLLEKHCREKGLNFVPFGGFGEIVAHLERVGWPG